MLKQAHMYLWEHENAASMCGKTDHSTVFWLSDQNSKTGTCTAR